MPNLLSYYAQTLPDAVHRASMFFFWFAEIPAPFLFLSWGRLRIVAAVATIVCTPPSLLDLFVLSL
jgi:hypothetical protein